MRIFRMRQENECGDIWNRWKTGGRYTLKGTEKDFPLTLHHSAYTGTDREKQEVEIPLTEGAELPQMKFHYGTVDFYPLMQEDVIWDDGGFRTGRRRQQR